MDVRPLVSPTASQRSEITSLLTHAFWQTPLFASFLFPGRPKLAKLFLRTMLDYAQKAGRVFIATQTDGSIAACALWSTPNSPELTLGAMLRLGLFPRMAFLALCSPAAACRVNELFAMLNRYGPDFPCATLEFLASAQKGAGAEVLTQSMKAFDGLPLYVESIVSKNDHAFYRRFGFSPFAYTDFHGTNYAFLLLNAPEDASQE